MGSLSDTMSQRKHALSINPNVLNTEYAVRGEIAQRAEQIQAELECREDLLGAKPKDGLPFDEVTSANIGNPQQLGQQPITFFRQVLSLLENPALLDHPEVLSSTFGYQQDVLDRAHRLLREVGSVGAYSSSAGVRALRQTVAESIQRRDGFPARWEDIFFSTGATSGVKTLLTMIATNPEVGVLLPIPQYPLYTATLSLLNLHAVPYHLNESDAWRISVNDIKVALEQARTNGVDVRAIVVINPGNPTGASLSYTDIQEVLKLAYQHNLVIIADEVYQSNVFMGEFYSFKKVLQELVEQDDVGSHFESIQLASLHSSSKGLVGECGHRGGYFELIGFDDVFRTELLKLISTDICPPVIGQCLMALVMDPPRQGDLSYDRYVFETEGIKNGLLQRSTALYRGFQKMGNVECGHPQGAMYLFPKLEFPPAAIKAAAEAFRSSDEFYCMRLLEATGICVVPGSGFGQRPGTVHLRTTFLAPGVDWIERWTKFHEDFMNEYS